MKKIIVLKLLLLFFFQFASAQYYTKQQAFEYEVMNKGRGDVSLKQIRTDYKNALMLESGGRVITGLGLIVMPVGLLSELSSNLRNTSLASHNNSSSGKGVVTIGLLITGLGAVTWTIGSIDKKKVINGYIEKKHGIHKRASEKIGTLKSTSNGFVFNYSF